MPKNSRQTYWPEALCFAITYHYTEEWWDLLIGMPTPSLQQFERLERWLYHMTALASQSQECFQIGSIIHP